jgi:phosphate starvation-inducible PhoH-like protein
MENTITFAPATKERHKPIDLVPRTRNQERLVMALMDWDSPVVVTLGPAGTGKTYLAMQAAVRALRRREIERIVLTRPAVGVEDERHGFLPGNLVAKMEPWTRPLLDVLREYYRPQEIQGMIEDQIIEIAPLAFMRGRTFRDAWIVGDEMQNATPAQVKMLLTRIGTGSKIVITGDVEQADRRAGDNGLLDLATRLQSNSVDSIKVCEFTDRDIQRHPVIKSVLDLYASA